MTESMNMTRGKPMKLLFLFALPLMFGNVFQQLYTVVDTAIVGRGVGMDALAALGAVDWLNWLFFGIIQGYSQGFSVRISQKFGQGDYAGMKRIAGQSAFLSIVIAIVVTALGLSMIPLFFKLLQVPENLQDMAGLYIRILLLGYPAVVFFNYCASLLRAVGNSKAPLYAMIAASVTNVILDCIAVFVLKWGIAGAAIATITAQALSGLVCFLYLKKVPQLHFQKKDFLPRKACCRDLLGLGSPLVAKNTVIALGGMVVQRIVNGFSLSFIAGFTATNKLYGILEIAAISYNHAVTTYVGQNFGAGRLDRVKEGMKASARLGIITAAVIGGIMLIFGRPITMLFISRQDPVLALEAGNIAYWYLSAMSVSLPALYMLFVFQAGLQGMGHTLATFLSGIIELALRVSLSFLVAYTGFQYGIFGAEVSAWWGAGIYLILTFLQKYKKVSRQ